METEENLADHKLTLSQVIKKNPEGSLWNVSYFINLCLGQLGDFWNLEEEIIVSLVPLHLLSLSVTGSIYYYCTGELFLMERPWLRTGKLKG